MSHLDFETISELAERGETRADTTEERHIAECDECRDTLRRVRALLALTRTLPRDIEPPADVWPPLRERMRRARLVGASASGPWLRGAIRAGRPWLAAAMLLFGVLTLATQWMSPGKAKAVKPAPGAGIASATSGGAAAAVERNYAATLDELNSALAAQRPTLAPAAVAVVERTLATIDTAIAEARTALTSDPRNQELVEILSAHYERKVDLLQRAAELGPSF